jgi:hypothetical protein
MVQRVMGRRSRVRGVLGSPLPTETTGEQPPSAGKRTWGTGFPLGLHTGHGFLVLSPGSSLVHGLTGDRVAGVLWSRRRHPPEDRAPITPQLSRSHLSLSISRLSHLSVLSRSHLSISLLPQSLRLSVCVCVRVEQKRRKNRRKRRNEEELVGGAAKLKGENIPQ